MEAGKRFRRFFLRGVIFCVVVLVILWGVNTLSLPRQYLGQATITLLEKADSVQVIRLQDQEPHDRYVAQISDFPLAYEGKKQGKDFAVRLTQILKDPRLYWGFNDVSCLIDPGVAYRVWSGKQCVKVILCFHCNQMIITSKNEQGIIVRRTYTEMVTMRRQMIALAKDAFPKDVEIQGLK